MESSEWYSVIEKTAVGNVLQLQRKIAALREPNSMTNGTNCPKTVALNEANDILALHKKMLRHGMVAAHAETEMESPYKRRKQPELVKRTLIDEAARLAVAEGLASVTVQAVSEAAGVTKGGCIHHFPSKKDLIDAVFGELLEAIDRDIEARMAEDPEPYGSFTRAYINSVFEKNLCSKGGRWAPLTISALTDPYLRALVADWSNERAARHVKTDGEMHLRLARFAADGIWLAYLYKIDVTDAEQLRADLLAITTKKN
jgi:AcrR family transcriptional regulator